MAGQRTIEEWTEASKMPPLAFILDRRDIRQLEPIEPSKSFTSLADIDIEKCPKNWTPEEVFRAKRTMQHYRESR